MFRCEVDLSDLANLGMDVQAKVRVLAEQAQHDLGAATFVRIKQIAHEKLHTRYTMFTDKFSMDEKDGEVILTLEASAVWIDEGLKPNYLLEALLASPKAKTSKSGGGKYIVVPFIVDKSGKGPTTTTPYNMELMDAVRGELKVKKLNKVQRDAQGRPLWGKVAELTNIKTPLKTHEGPGMGQGGIGDERQSRNKIPYLKGASVYQHEGPGGKIQRSVITYRTASSNHPENFQHPGLPATNIIEDGYEWAMNELETSILPKLIQKVLNL